MTFRRQACATFKFQALELEVTESFNKNKVLYVPCLTDGDIHACLDRSRTLSGESSSLYLS